MRILSSDRESLYDLKGNSLSIQWCHDGSYIVSVVGFGGVVEFSTKEGCIDFIKKVVAVTGYGYDCIIAVDNSDNFIVKSGSLYSEIEFSMNDLGLYRVMNSKPIKGSKNE